MDYSNLLIDIVFGVAITVVAYFLVHMFLVISKKKFSKKAIKRVVIINSVVVCVGFAIYRLISTGELVTTSAVFLWTPLVYKLLSAKCMVDEQDHNEVKNMSDAELQKIISFSKNIKYYPTHYG